MNASRVIHTNGDPLNAVRGFMKNVWSQANLDGLLVPLNGSEESIPHPKLIDDPDLLGGVNPFKPLMTSNAARLIPDLVRDHPQSRLGALLRPCEMRALVEMVKHDSFDIERFLTICIDCLGTLSLDEYRWRAARKETPARLTEQSLQFARQGGILAYRYRSSCQICLSPEARGADLNINVLGLPVRQHILVQPRDRAIGERLEVEGYTHGEAHTTLVEQHERVLAKMAERNRRTMERVARSLGESLPKDVDALVEQFQSCGDCQSCMEVCPICAVDFPQRGADNHYQRKDVTRWLISCAGCGMCEQSCAKHLPLGTIFQHIRKLLADEFGYTAGRSIDDPLPVH